MRKTTAISSCMLDVCGSGPHTKGEYTDADAMADFISCNAVWSAVIVDSGDAVEVRVKLHELRFRAEWVTSSPDAVVEFVRHVDQWQQSVSVKTDESGKLKPSTVWVDLDAKEVEVYCG